MGKRGLVGRRSFLRLAGTGLAGGAAALLDPALAGASPGLTVRGGDADGGATVAGAPISHAKVVVPMVFPVLGGRATPTRSWPAGGRAAPASTSART